MNSCNTSKKLKIKHNSINYYYHEFILTVILSFCSLTSLASSLSRAISRAWASQDVRYKLKLNRGF